MLDRYFASGMVDEQFISKTSDIIVRLFPPFVPVLITKTITGFVIPSQFAIIRLPTNELLPEFLCCYLAHRSILKSLAILESGQAASGIKISALSDLPVPLPNAEKQRAIAAYSDLNAKKKRLHIELLKQYDLKLDAVINSIIEGEEHGNDQKRY